MADIDSNLPVKDTSDGTLGASAPSMAQQIGGKDGSGNLQAIKVDTSGRPQITINGATDGTAIGNVSDSLKTNVTNTVAVSQSGTWSVNQGTSPWISNISQFGGNNVVTGTGASGLGVPRVTVSNDSNVLSTQSGTWTVQPGNTANTTPWLTTINQGGNSAVVKASSTSPVITDAALTVSISPNSIIRAEPNQQIFNGNAFTTQTGPLTVNNSETNIFYFKNNSLTKTVYIFNLGLFQDPSNGNNWMEFKLYYSPTIAANGTAGSVYNLYAGSSNTSASNAYTIPTASARGNPIAFFPAGYNNAAFQTSFLPFPNYYLLAPGQSLLISAVAKANGQGAFVNLMWFEV